MKPIKYAVIFLLTTISLFIDAIDNPHFYRATNILPEPRLEHDYLFSFDTTLGSGSTTQGRNSSGKMVSLFDIYGENSIAIDNIVIPFSIDGKFKIIESNIQYAQNLLYGVLLYFHLPVRNIQIKDISFFNQGGFAQKQFASILDQKLLNSAIEIAPSHEIGVGDFSALVGWTHNYQETNKIDFIDGTVMVGFLAPTGKKKNERNLLSLPLGYNGHWGFPIHGMISLGACEWLTVGAYSKILLFLDSSGCVALKTVERNAGMIKLAQGDVLKKRGLIWDAGCYIKADHFAYGLSLAAAYSYAGERKSLLIPKNKDIFDSCVINSDSMLKGWNMHTMSFSAEYDFAKQDSKIGLRIGGFYNWQIKGVRTFNTNICSGTFGLDIAWDL